MTRFDGVPWGCKALPNQTTSRGLRVHAQETKLIQGIDGAILNIDDYAEPVSYSTKLVPMRRVTCKISECVGGRSAPITGQEKVAGGTDRQIILVDLDRRRTYELYQARVDEDGTLRVNADGSVTAGGMSVVDLDGPGNKTADGKNLNITGAGVSRMFGLIRAHEIRAAAIDPPTAIPHALQVSLPKRYNCADTWRAPATKTDGRATGACVEEGALLRLDASFECTSMGTRMGQAICSALQRYGAYNIDNNGSRHMAFYGQNLRSWATGDGDYAAAGIDHDYARLDLPLRLLRSYVRGQ